MKKLVTALFLIISISGLAQKAKVEWKFASKKISEGNYEVTATAVVPKGWHLYSQFTGEGPVPTTFTFNKNALVILEGKVTEKGKMESKFDAQFKSNQKYLTGSVVFTQKVKLKTKIKTNVSGEVEYMICDDKQCLPPTIQKFNITL